MERATQLIRQVFIFLYAATFEVADLFLNFPAEKNKSEMHLFFCSYQC